MRQTGKKNGSLAEILILGLASLISVAAYLLISSQEAGLGFPLDDAWIHQTFARNLARSQEWSFQQGQLSGGSTGPAWGFLLAAIYALKLPVLGGTYLLGWLSLWAASAAAFLLCQKLLPEMRFGPILCGLLIALEWHLVWAAASGMETILLIAVVLWLFFLLIKTPDSYWTAGLLVGFSAWVRPDGITMAAPALLSMLLRPGGSRVKIRWAFQFLLGLILLAGPYFLFNRATAGEIWPTTYFAKQAEYAFLNETSILGRYWNMGLQVLVGVGAVLLPGFVYQSYLAWRDRNWALAAMLAWYLGYLAIYAWRLPVVYQHGRYLMPAMPVYLVLALLGTLQMLKPGAENTAVRIVSRSAALAGFLVAAAFWGLGGRAYARDVGVIETEMVACAHWVRENTPSDALVAAHDIGALGYYGDRRLLDLAGLISPDVIPFIQDQTQLASYLDREGADYLVVFPGWYPSLVDDLPLVYQGTGVYTEIFGMEHMAVYIWK